MEATMYVRAYPRSFAALPLAAIVGLSLLAPVARGTYHLMQIEQVIGGVNGDKSVQAIQLGMRVGGQDLLWSAGLVVRDSQGKNPVVLFDFTSSVTNDAVGARILVASEGFVSLCSGLKPDFTLTNLIPDSYFNSGSLTFETD